MIITRQVVRCQVISDIKQASGDNKQGQVIACRSQVSSNSTSSISTVDITI